MSRPPAGDGDGGMWHQTPQRAEEKNVAPPRPQGVCVGEGMWHTPYLYNEVKKKQNPYIYKKSK